MGVSHVGSGWAHGGAHGEEAETLQAWKTGALEQVRGGPRGLSGPRLAPRAPGRASSEGLYGPVKLTHLRGPQASLTP